MKTRIRQIEWYMKYPHDAQNKWFNKLIAMAAPTEWGRKYDYKSIKNPDDFRFRVPVNDYEALKPFIERMRAGEQNVLWPSDIKWFSQSSGTTADKSKYIPVSREALDDCHFKGGRDMLTMYCNNYPQTKLFSGKAIGMSGTYNYQDSGSNIRYGDISAILLRHLPFWITMFRTPVRSVALLGEWETKIEQIARLTMKQNVTSITGVPSWTLILLKHILSAAQKDNIAHVWPNLELFVHGGVSFEPYRDQFKKICPPEMNYMEAYNASEGFFAIQDTSQSEMLLMPDHGVYYEFMPLSELGKDNPKTCLLHEVNTSDQYAVIISTNAGLWRYMIGDTIRFTNLSPYRIRIMGRTRLFINAVGEELMIDNAERAMAITCQSTGAVINEFTAAPVYFGEQQNAAHEWIVEFVNYPDHIENFTHSLDNALKSQNSDYEAKRHNNMVLRAPVITVVENGTFYEWMKSKGKLGGQNKVPRLSNDRRIADEIIAFVQSQKKLKKELT